MTHLTTQQRVIAEELHRRVRHELMLAMRDGMGIAARLARKLAADPQCPPDASRALELLAETLEETIRRGTPK